MHGHDLGLGIADNYRAFAQEARGRCPAYEQLAASVAHDAVMLGFLDSLPPEKRQPNLLFAAARYLLGATPDLDGLGALAAESRPELTGVILDRRTQTNEQQMSNSKVRLADAVSIFAGIDGAGLDSRLGAGRTGKEDGCQSDPPRRITAVQRRRSAAASPSRSR